jgi:hypothetical protein
MPRNFDLRKGFIDQTVRNTEVFDPTFDEPTYLSFRIRLYSDDPVYKSVHMSYDELPQALFTNETATSSENIEKFYLTRPKSNMTRFEASRAMNDRPYSAVQYLITKNEDYRAWCLAKFIEGFNDIQFYAPHFIQGISGIGDIFKTSPDKGWGIDKNALIKISCLESLDERIKYLLSLYRTAVWDNKYQRFILPDIFRMFKMDIYISEIRSFHISNMSNTGGFQDLLTNTLFTTGISIGGKSYSVNSLLSSAIGKVNETTHGLINNNTKIDPLSLSILDGICPVTCIHCEMCDLDVRENLFGNELKANPPEMETTNFTVRVKKAEVYHHWLLRGDNIWVTDLGSWSERAWGPSPVVKSMKEMTHEWFTGDMYLADADRTHSYTQTIETGGISNGLKQVAGGLATAGSWLDVAADIYNGFKEAKNAYNAAKNKNVLSAATDSDNEISAGSFLKYVGEMSKANTENKEVINLLRSSMKEYSTLERSQRLQIEQYYDRLRNEVRGYLSEKTTNPGDRSTATDFDGGPSPVPEKEIVSKSGVHMGTLTSIEQGEDRSLSTDLDNKPNLSIVGPDSHIDKSKATDLDGGPDGNLTPIKQPSDKSDATDLDGGPTGNLTPVPQPKDKSDATDLDGGPTGNLTPMPQNDDRSLATDLDGGPEGTLTPIKQPTDKSEATDLDGGPDGNLTPIEQPKDKSDATDLDGGPTGNLVPVPQPKDRSDATNLDGGPDGTLTPIEQPDDKSEATDLDGGPEGNLIPVPQPSDRSDATDLDGGPKGELTPIGQPDDKSEATDLDGGPTGNLVPVPQPRDKSEATDLDGGPDGELVPITQPEDRSEATDLDGGPNSNNLIEIEQPDDKSEATDLDGGPDGGLIPVGQPDDRSLATDLDGMEEQELFHVEQPEDRSEATDLDGGPDGELIPVTQPEDRSEATDLDGGPDGTLISVPQIDDRSLATDLDGWNGNSVLTPNEGATTDEETEEGNDEQTLIPNFNYGDRSLATDLDGGPDGNLVPMNDRGADVVQENLVPNRHVIDRSLATDLDGGPDGEPLSLFEQYANQVKSKATSSTRIDGGDMREEFKGKTVADVIQMVAELKDEADRLKQERIEKIIQDELPDKDERIERLFDPNKEETNKDVLPLVENKPKTETKNSRIVL